MPDLKDRLIVPVEVPAWAVITFLISGAFGYGILYSELKSVVKAQEKVDLMYERQIRNIEAVNRHESVLVDLNRRVAHLEMERAR